MIKKNIFSLLYKYSPLNFYTNTDNRTIIKSIHNPSAGYEFDREFNPEEIHNVWKEIRLHRRISTISIFILFLAALYEFIFPHFSLFLNNTGFINALVMLAVLLIVCNLSTLICQKAFEKRLFKLCGEYKTVKFVPTEYLDKKYYTIFKFELIKAIAVITIIVSVFMCISPFEIAQKLVHNGRYAEVIKLTTVGANIFPIAQEWYALRGYAKYKIGDYQGAIADYDTAYKLSADEFNIMNFDNKIYISNDYIEEILNKSSNKDLESYRVYENNFNELKKIINTYETTYNKSGTYYYLTLPHQEDLEYINTIYTFLAKYINIITLVFALFTILLFSNFIYISISYSKKQIGILRALGTNKNDIIKIFLYESIIVGVIAYIISIILWFIAINLLNNSLFGDKTYILNGIVTNPWVPVIMFIYTIIISIIITIISLSKITKIKPIDAILNK